MLVFWMEPGMSGGQNSRRTRLPWGGPAPEAAIDDATSALRGWWDAYLETGRRMPVARNVADLLSSG